MPSATASHCHPAPSATASYCHPAPSATPLPPNAVSNTTATQRRQQHHCHPAPSATPLPPSAVSNSKPLPQSRWKGHHLTHLTATTQHSSRCMSLTESLVLRSCLTAAVQGNVSVVGDLTDFTLIPHRHAPCCSQLTVSFSTQNQTEDRSGQVQNSHMFASVTEIHFSHCPDVSQ